MDQSVQNLFKRTQWRFLEGAVLVTLYIFLLIISGNCQTIYKDESSQIDSLTKTDLSNIDSIKTNTCHSCQINSDSNNSTRNKENEIPSVLRDLVDTVSSFSEKYVFINKTERELQKVLEEALDDSLKKDRFEIFEGVEIKTIEGTNRGNEQTEKEEDRQKEGEESRALFSTYTYEYRLLQKIKNFVDTHILSINLPKAARLIGFRSFGLKNLFLPLLIGAQVFKSILLAMFLPSILGSFGKILGKGISQISAASSQASYPPANGDDQTAYNNDNMGYETNPTATYAYNDAMYGNDANDVNDLSNVDMSRFGAGGQKVSYLPTKNGYYKNQMSTSNSYKIFQKIPASSMILSNYDPFYSPLLSRLDGIFARLGLTPPEAAADDSMQIGGQTLSEVKLEACREQLICLMYASPAKYAPYSNLISAQLSRELNELRRPVSDNPEILRFFRYMRAARRGQEGTDCVRAHPACSAAAPTHTMIAAYHDINKLVTARKI